MILSVELLILMVSIALTSTVAESQICYLPRAMELNVEKLIQTTWYSGLRTDDIASMLSCVRFSNFTSTESGFKVITEEQGVSTVEFDLNIDYGVDGTYRLRESQKEYFHEGHVKMNGLDSETVMDMDNFLTNGNSVYLTDYENYLTLFLCPSNGIADKEHRMIRGFFPSPNPTLSQVAAFINALHEIGIFAKFYASTCSEIY
ncbi:uncharacterized protein LOC120335504 isoform X2 [Styela clava]